MKCTCFAIRIVASEIKKFIHKDTSTCDCRIIIIILTAIRVPASVQLADKNKTGCNPIQSCHNTKISAGIYTEIPPLTD